MVRPAQRVLSALRSKSLFAKHQVHCRERDTEGWDISALCHAVCRWGGAMLVRDGGC